MKELVEYLVSSITCAPYLDESTCAMLEAMVADVFSEDRDVLEELKTSDRCLFGIISVRNKYRVTAYHARIQFERLTADLSEAAVQSAIKRGQRATNDYVLNHMLRSSGAYQTQKECVEGYDIIVDLLDRLIDFFRSRKDSLIQKSIALRQGNIG